ncbi:hypothetical protein FACS1894169_00980 [Bacteroidia bacterium]|nr:hypothetical protein FACS1894169_00980 [Bacteroidia bacterium]
MGKYDKILLEYDKHCRRIAQATTIRINETPQEREKRKARLRKNYGDWFEYYFPNYAKVKCAPFHLTLANLIVKYRIIRLLAEWYRSAAKSVHINMGIPLFLYLELGELKFMLLIGQTEPKAKKLLSGIQAQLMYNKRLIQDYGEKFKYGDWADGDFSTVDGVRFMALGFGQDPRGAREEAERPDYITVDDADSKRHVNNDRLMGEYLDFITEDVWGCFDAAEGGRERFVYANNNFHKNSLTNRLKNYFLQARQKAKDEGYENIFFISTVNAVKDLNTFKPSWEAKTSAAYWRKKYNSMPYRSFMREYMNTHIAEGKVFKAEWVQYTKILPYHKYDSIVAYGDLSFKDNACLKSIVFIGKIGRQFHFLHVFFRQTTRPAVAKWLYDTYEDRKLAGKNIRYMFEGLFAMSMFTNDFDEEGDIRGYYIPIVPNTRPKGEKEGRIEASAGFWERRNCYLNEDEKNNSDQILFVDTMLAFEIGAKIPLDGLDAAEGALSEVNRAVKIDKGNENVRVKTRKEIQSKSKNRF